METGLPDNLSKLTFVNIYFPNLNLQSIEDSWTIALKFQVAG